jgi:hypothetical protein
MSIQAVIHKLEVKHSGLSEDPNWLSLLGVIDKHIPTITSICIGTVYMFQAKNGRIARGVVTKENTKTWVLYEDTESGKPGTRWMISKGWCREENIWRDTAQSYNLPEGVVLK